MNRNKIWTITFDTVICTPLICSEPSVTVGLFWPSFVSLFLKKGETFRLQNEKEKKRGKTTLSLRTLRRIVNAWRTFRGGITDLWALYKHCLLNYTTPVGSITSGFDWNSHAPDSRQTAVMTVRASAYAASSLFRGMKITVFRDATSCSTLAGRSGCLWYTRGLLFYNRIPNFIMFSDVSRLPIVIFLLWRSFDQIRYYLNYSLTPWSRGLPEKLTGPQLVQKFPAYCLNYILR